MDRVRGTLKQRVILIGGCLAIMWLAEIADAVVFRGSLDRLGIYPRQVSGLPGIVFAPFLHGNFQHLMANTLPFITLGWLVMIRESTDFIMVTLLSTLLGGLGTWLFASNGYHIGASGVVFGYLGFLLARGYFDRHPLNIAISVLVAVLYSRVLWGLLPANGISWEGHLFGLLSGIAIAKFASPKHIS